MLQANARAWISDNNEEGTYWAENLTVRVEIQRTDENEVRIGVQTYEADTDDVTLYFTVAEASRLAHMLGIAVLANEAAAHEAASL